MTAVFIVDDSAPVRAMVAEFLGLDPEVTVAGEAASGAEALERLASAPCDVVLIDVSMPGMNGIELARRLAALRPGLPCVMYSAHAEEVYVRQAEAAGARGYVTKGEPEALLRALAAVAREETFFDEAIEAVRRAD